MAFSTSSQLPYFSRESNQVLPSQSRDKTRSRRAITPCAGTKRVAIALSPTRPGWRWGFWRTISFICSGSSTSVAKGLGVVSSGWLDAWSEWVRSSHTMPDAGRCRSRLPFHKDITTWPWWTLDDESTARVQICLRKIFVWSSMSGSIAKDLSDGSIAHDGCQQFKFCHDGLEWSQFQLWFYS